MLNKLNLAIVDVETSGSSAIYDRIIEIGVHRIEQGRLARSYSTLINPSRAIPPMITQITGIKDEDVADAPFFGEIAQQVYPLLQGCIFVAHNVRFDYGFVRNEFERAGIVFAADCLCSVRLSRLLYPRHKRHSLSALIERFEFPCANRHRALDDAAVVWAFFRHIQAQVEPQKINRALSQLLKIPVLPPNLNVKDIDALPSGPGVYIFYDKKDNPIYIGRSLEVRDRVLSRFSSDSAREKQLCRQTARIEAHIAYGELGMWLLEAHLMKGLFQLGSARMRKTKGSRRVPAWAYPGPVVIEEKHHSGAKGHLFVVDQWRLIKALRFEGEEFSSWFSGAARADYDTYTMFAKYLLSHPRNVRSLSKTSADALLEGNADLYAGFEV